MPWIDRLRPGASIFCAGGMGHPSALVAALDAHAEATRGVTVVWTRPAGFFERPPKVPGGTLVTFFGGRDLDGVAGHTRFVPIQYRRLFDWLERDAVFDVALLQLTPPGPDGRCSYGLGVDFAPAVIERAGFVVAELNAALPSPPGAPSVELEHLDWWVETLREPPCVERAVDDEVTTAIARRVADLVEDGDCVQTGIGALPDAVLHGLRDRRHLGCHSGVISDGVRELFEAGVLDGSRKTIDRGLLVTGFLLGSRALYDWAARCPELLMRPVSYTHDARVLAQIDRLLAINSALEVDLFGQVNAEVLQGRQVSGTGGAVDFARGAALSRGGRSIVALPATAARGTVSRIVPALAPAAAATTLRTDIDAVVTEHGVAWLRAKSIEERAEALVAVAAPGHRDRLAKEWAAVHAGR
ncbi:MAG TPA: acetyl-CoA hydrolase/transferase C-terminal domain-containing protein [Thermoanaerobaculia bacterium]|nr:acetyl-CoA hydrolase/transferase C-terminal domain-containing protein [Thermoanaerobaculia bacterium]